MKTTNENLMNLAEELVNYGREKGADQVEVAISDGTEFSAEVREGKIDKLVEAGSRELEVKVIVEQKLARASSSDLAVETLHNIVDGALERAKLLSADPFAGLPEKEDVAVDADALDIFDPKIVDLPAEEKIAAAIQTESICLKDERVKKSYGAAYGTYAGTTYLANSNGFSGSYPQTTCVCGIYLQAGDGENLFDEGKYDFSRNLDTLMSPEEIAHEAVHRVTRLIGARKVETQEVPVVLEPDMTASLLRFLSQCIDGENVYMKQTFLADRLGEKVGNDRVTVVDDGLMPGVIGAKPFDREGVPTRKTTVIERGVLKSYLLDTYAARKLKMKSSGNASGPNNLYLEAGPTPPEKIIQSVKKGLLLTGTIGFGLVPTTGDISRGAFGMWIENGEVSYPVSEITISANLGELLQNIRMVGDDLKFKQSVNAPTILVEGMTIGGL